jgi:hypothetical protein
MAELLVRTDPDQHVQQRGDADVHRVRMRPQRATTAEQGGT